MMLFRTLLPILFLSLIGCSQTSENKETNASDKTSKVSSQASQAKDEVPDGLKPLVEKAKSMGHTPTSIRLNFASGYWHLGAAVNTTEVGKNVGYEGIWFQMHDSHLLTVGKNSETLYQGAWAWDEEPQMLTFLAPLNDDWWLNEWKTINRGDLYVCMGNTPNNKRSTQFKLVRKQSKFVD